MIDMAFARRSFGRGYWHLVGRESQGWPYGRTACGIPIRPYWGATKTILEDVEQTTLTESDHEMEPGTLAPFCVRCVRTREARGL